MPNENPQSAEAVIAVTQKVSGQGPRTFFEAFPVVPDDPLRATDKFPLRVGFSATRKAFTGNYSSVEVGVWVEVPTTLEALERNFDGCKQWTLLKLKGTLDKMLAKLGQHDQEIRYDA